MIKLGAIACSIAAAGWGAHVYLVDTFADRGDVMVASAKADFVLDRHIASTVAQIAHLERQERLTPGQVEQLRYLREQLDQMRRVRSGK